MMKPTATRGQHADQTGSDHHLQGRRGADGDAGRRIGLARAFHEARDFAELTADFLHHLARGLANRGHGHGGDQIGNDAADEDADDHQGIGDVDGIQTNGLGVGHEQGQGGQSGGADGESLADGGGGVAQGVQFIGDRAGFGAKFGHFGDAARVIGDGAVGVHGHGGADGGEHAHRGDADSEHARHLIGDVGGGADAQTAAGRSSQNPRPDR